MNNQLIHKLYDKENNQLSILHNRRNRQQKFQTIEHNKYIPIAGRKHMNSLISYDKITEEKNSKIRKKQNQNITKKKQSKKNHKGIIFPAIGMKSIEKENIQGKKKPNTKKGHSHSVKKMITQGINKIQSLIPQSSISPTLLSPSFENLGTPSLQSNIKQLLIGIMADRHQASIEDEMDKLQTITKRYSNLRKDLACIQKDKLTMSLKKIFKQQNGNKDKDIHHNDSLQQHSNNQQHHTDIIYQNW